MVCDRLSLSYGTNEILKDVSFSINEGVKLGVIGINGAGKSTLANIITGRIMPTSGSVYILGNISVGMLDQRNEDDFKGKNVFGCAVSSFAELVKTEERLENCFRRYLPIIAGGGI